MYSMGNLQQTDAIWKFQKIIYWRFVAHKMASPKTVDVVIVGAGMSGLCAAYELLKKRPQTNLVVLEAKGRP